MRRITAGQVTVFLLLLGVIFALALATTWLALGRAPLEDFRGVTLVAAALVFVYLYAFAVYRVFLAVAPLPRGEIAPGSSAEFVAQVDTLFYLFLFYPIITTRFLPVPLMRLVYLALGARLGADTYSAGAILDPPLTRMGAGCIVGHGAVLYAHAIEGDRFSLNPIEIGDRVTIGAMAVVMSDVVIADGAIVSAGAVVTKGTRIGAGEVWGGVPAKPIRPVARTAPAQAL